MELTKQEREEIWVAARRYAGAAYPNSGGLDFWSKVVTLATSEERELKHKKLMALRTNHGRKRLKDMTPGEASAAWRLRGDSPDNPILDT